MFLVNWDVVTFLSPPTLSLWKLTNNDTLGNNSSPSKLDMSVVSFRYKQQQEEEQQQNPTNKTQNKNLYPKQTKTQTKT